MLNSFVLNIKTLEKSSEVIEGVTFLKGVSLSGEFGILPNHTPSVIQLASCNMTVRAESEVKTFFVSKGFVYISGDAVTLITPFIEFSEEIDLNRAKNSLQRAQKRLDSGDALTDMSRARLSLLRAKCRLSLTS
jgi:F-type H+-transporting ATPase subunit epsilon